MHFTNQELSILRNYSGPSNPVEIKLINKLGQEFSIHGFIPRAYSNMENKTTPNLSVQPDYLMFRFGFDRLSNIRIKAPLEINSLNIEKIIDNKGNILYENEDYFLQKLDILANIEDKYGHEECFTTLHPFKNIVDKFLGKVIVYVGKDIPGFKGEKALVTFIGRGKDFKNNVRIKLEAGAFKANLDIPANEIDENLEISNSQYEEIINEL